MVVLTMRAAVGTQSGLGIAIGVKTVILSAKQSTHVQLFLQLLGRLSRALLLLCFPLLDLLPAVLFVNLELPILLHGLLPTAVLMGTMDAQAIDVADMILDLSWVGKSTMYADMASIVIRHADKC